MMNTIFGVVSVVGSLIAAYLSYEIYRYNRLSKAWLAVTVAFILIIFRRAIGFATEAGVWLEYRPVLKFVESVLLILISVLYILGFWSMKRSFETFDVVEKKVQDKVKAFRQRKSS